jgi:hypothetical protein
VVEVIAQALEYGRVSPLFLLSQILRDLVKNRSQGTEVVVFLYVEFE